MPETTRKTPRQHLEEFFEEYEIHKDFQRAKGKHNSGRYVALGKISKKPDEECDELEKKLKELWVTRKTPRQHLEEFFEEYETHKNFRKARGWNNSTRHKALAKISRKPDEECDDLEKKFKELWVGWQTIDLQKHLKDFFAEYEECRNFFQARGAIGTTRYKALAEINHQAGWMCSDKEKELKALWKEHKPKPKPKPKREVLELPDLPEFDPFTPSVELYSSTLARPVHGS